MDSARKKTELPWYRSIRLKLVATAIIVEAIMLGLLLSNSYRLVSNALESQTQTRLEALKPLLNASLAGHVFQRDHSEIDAILRQLVDPEGTEIRYIVVFDPHGKQLAYAGKLTSEQIDKTPLDKTVADALHDLTYDTRIPLTLQGDTEVGQVRFGLSLFGLSSLRGNVLLQSLVIAAAEIILSMLLLASGGYLLTRHIASLLAATRRVASADFSRPIRIGTQDEIGILADNFNRMQTEIQRRIEQLAESESRFRTIFDAAGDAFFIHDAQTGHLLDVNLRMCEMFGCTREQALNLPFERFCSTEAPYTIEHAIEKMKLTHTVPSQTFEWKARNVEGTEFWVEVNLRLACIGNEERVLALVRDISDRKRYQQKLEFLAHHDPLTQLPNRLLFADRLQQTIARTIRSNRLLAVILLDLDGFKPVNDRLGHEVGDRLLILVAQRLRECMRAGDTVSRIGGDEFALLIGDLTSMDEGTLAFNRLLDFLSQPFQVNSHTLNISASIGITIFPFDEADADTLLRHADQAMYVAKQGGRNRYHLFDPKQDRQSQAEHDSRARIVQALEEGQFVMHYQPQVDMQAGRVIGVEALIRWQHPDKRLLAPAHFLPLVENSELAGAFGEWVITTVLAQMQEWQRAGLKLKVGINISAHHLQTPDFVSRLAALLTRFPGVARGTVELEVVESVALDDMSRVSDVIDACHDLGVTFALDDFGTGYSSLSYFKQLRIDTLKIDQSFIRDMLLDEEDHAIVEGVIGLTHSFKRDVIAEGVESAEIGVALLSLGCHFAQGYGIAKPMPPEEVPGWIAAWQPDPSWRR